MNTLTLSRFSRAFATTQEPKDAPAMPTGAPLAPLVSTKTQRTITPPEPAILPIVSNNQVEGEDMATKDDLKAKLDALKAQVASAEKELEGVRGEERNGVLVRMKADMLEYGIQVAELIDKPLQATKARGAAKGVLRGPAPIKFRDTATGAAWSGRGQKPRWLRAALEDGKKLEDYAVSE